jgi:SPP1 family predicted phage head-tail adaptor
MKIGNAITNPSELNQRVTLKSRTVSTGTGGFQAPSYTTIAVVWAKWVGVHGSEAWAANAVNAMLAATVTIRYRNDIDPTCILGLDGENYEIVSPDDIRMRHEYIELKVKRVVPG